MKFNEKEIEIVMKWFSVVFFSVEELKLAYLKINSELASVCDVLRKIEFD